MLGQQRSIQWCHARMASVESVAVGRIEEPVRCLLQPRLRMAGGCLLPNWRPLNRERSDRRGPRHETPPDFAAGAKAWIAVRSRAPTGSNAVIAPLDGDILMNTHFKDLTFAFDRIGAAATVRPSARWSIDVETVPVTKRRGGPRFREVFRLTIPLDCDVIAVDVAARDRHLLLHVHPAGVARPWKVLAGHDERHWFCASVPGRPASVIAAKRALMPELVATAAARSGLQRKKAMRRRTQAFVRQGEWFFVPMPEWDPGSLPVLKNEPISRGTLGLGIGSPHWCAELVRMSVETVVQASSNRGRFDRLETTSLDDAIERGLWIHQRWSVPQFCAVRGTIRHRDHQTLDLGRIWHRVHMNNESQAPGRGHLLFLD